MRSLNKDSVKGCVDEAIKEARKSTCLNAKCGAIIINQGNGIIGRGFNSPPGNLKSQRRCLIKKREYNKKLTDKTCCIHAEQRAIFDALDKYGKKALENYAVLYFMRVDEEGSPISAGEPYCTICSKSAVDVGISNWVLQHNNGLYIYDSEEYNNLSFNFRKN